MFLSKLTSYLAILAPKVPFFRAFAPFHQFSFNMENVFARFARICTINLFCRQKVLDSLSRTFPPTPSPQCQKEIYATVHGGQNSVALDYFSMHWVTVDFKCLLVKPSPQGILFLHCPYVLPYLRILYLVMNRRIDFRFSGCKLPASFQEGFLY